MYDGEKKIQHFDIENLSQFKTINVIISQQTDSERTCMSQMKQTVKKTVYLYNVDLILCTYTTTTHRYMRTRTVYECVAFSGPSKSCTKV